MDFISLAIIFVVAWAIYKGIKMKPTPSPKSYSSLNGGSRSRSSRSSSSKYGSSPDSGCVTDFGAMDYFDNDSSSSSSDYDD